jgi:hypothetical protein
VSVVVGQEGGGGMGGMNIVLTIIGGGLALSAVAIGILLLISSSHITMPAKCSPLEDPVYESRIRDKTGECFEFDSDVRVDAELKKKDKRCDKQEPDIFRSFVRVEGETLRSPDHDPFKHLPSP